MKTLLAMLLCLVFAFTAHAQVINPGGGGGGSVTLPQFQVGFGSPTNTVTGDVGLTYKPLGDAAGHPLLTVGNTLDIDSTVAPASNPAIEESPATGEYYISDDGASSFAFDCSAVICSNSTFFPVGPNSTGPGPDFYWANVQNFDFQMNTNFDFKASASGDLFWLGPVAGADLTFWHQNVSTTANSYTAYSLTDATGKGLYLMSQNNTGATSLPQGALPMTCANCPLGANYFVSTGVGKTISYSSGLNLNSLHEYMRVAQTTTPAVVFDFPPQLPGLTIATLPTCNSTIAGAQAYVTNGAASPVFLSAVSATGTTVAPVFCNGTNWIYY